jgi:hypothetical protein
MPTSSDASERVDGVEASARTGDDLAGPGQPDTRRSEEGIAGQAARGLLAAGLL